MLSVLLETVSLLRWQHVVMWAIGGILIYLAIRRKMEPALLLPMGFGAILVNLPLSGAVTQIYDGAAEIGALDVLFDAGVANELFPLLLFIGIGAMIDFTPLLSNPKLMIFGAAAQFGIFFTLLMALLFGFDLRDAVSVAVIGAADGPTSIFVANYMQSKYLGAIIVAAYSYMALVPIVQPPVIKLLTSHKERRIHMEYAPRPVSKTTKILFPIIVTVVATIIAPRSASLIGFLMFGNLVRECGVLEGLSETAQKTLANLVTLFLGITVASKMQADAFLSGETLMILGLGLVAFVFDTAGGQIPEPLPEEKDQSHDRRGGHFGVPHVGARGQQAGAGGGQPELPADARRGRERVRPDRLGGGGRTAAEPVRLTEDERNERKLECNAQGPARRDDRLAGRVRGHRRARHRGAAAGKIHGREEMRRRDREIADRGEMLSARRSATAARRMPPKHASV